MVWKETVQGLRAWASSFIAWGCGFGADLWEGRVAEGVPGESGVFGSADRGSCAAGRNHAAAGGRVVWQEIGGESAAQCRRKRGEVVPAAEAGLHVKAHWCVLGANEALEMCD